MSSRARNKIRQWWSRETREDTEQRGRESLEQALKQHNLPVQEGRRTPRCSPGVIREMNFKKAEEFYLALGSGKLPVSQVVAKVLHRLKTAEVAHEEFVPRKPKARSAVASHAVGISVPGRRGRAGAAREVLQPGARRRGHRLHLARQGDHDPPGATART